MAFSGCTHLTVHHLPWMQRVPHRCPRHPERPKNSNDWPFLTILGPHTLKLLDSCLAGVMQCTSSEACGKPWDKGVCKTHLPMFVGGTTGTALHKASGKIGLAEKQNQKVETPLWGSLFLLVNSQSTSKQTFRTLRNKKTYGTKAGQQYCSKTHMPGDSCCILNTLSGVPTSHYAPFHIKILCIQSRLKSSKSSEGAGLRIFLYCQK